MCQPEPTRREVIAAVAGLGLSASGGVGSGSSDAKGRPGHQRLTLEQLGRWQRLRYGMFIHFGMSTFVGQELPGGNDPPAVYAPEALDVDQWIGVARDAGMKYAVLTAKHVAGHCLWPSRHTSYTVSNSTDRTDVVGKFVRACERCGVSAGLYYCSWDNHHRFGSRTPSDPDTAWCDGQYDWAALQGASSEQTGRRLPAYTTSLYQEFQTAQIVELLTQYGPIAEVWIDIPGALGRGYRTFLYQRIAQLQPETVIMMNSGIGEGADYPVEYAWPSDLIAIERRLPPGRGHEPWREIEGKEYFLPGEVCDPIGKEWFHVPGDEPRADAELAEQLHACMQREVNFLLDVPPDRRGLIPDSSVKALMRLAKRL